MPNATLIYVKKDIMKKIIATCFFFIFCLPLYAQWSLGGKIGVNWSKVHFGNTLEDPSFKTGVNAGAVASFQLSQWFDVQAELTYSGQGYRMKDLIHMDEEGMDPKDLNVRYHYLSLPLLVKFYPFVKGFNMQAGIQAAYLLSKSVKLDDEKAGPEWIEDKPSFDCGLLFGLGYTFRNGLFLDGRYQLGLIRDDNRQAGFPNRSVEISLGYLFSF